MRRVFSIALLLLLVLPSYSQASILGSVLTFDSNVDTLLDESRASFRDNGDLVFGVGDTVYGFISISDTLPSGNVGLNQIAVLFAVTVSGTTVSQDGVTYFTHSAPVGGLASFLNAGLGPHVNPGVAPLGATLADAVAVVVSNSGSRDPLVPPVADTGSLTGFLASEWTYEATLGFDPDPLADDFLHLQAGAGEATERAGFSLFDHSFSGGINFLPVSVTRFGNDIIGAPFPPTSAHDVTLTGSVNLEPMDPVPGGWMFVDETRMQINPTPEPGSVLIWGGILTGVALIARRRVKNAA